MRFSESQIKAAILDADVEIRQRATSYFSNSFSTDESVMPLVIEAVEKYGREDAYQLIGAARDLPQTAETIAWVVDELNNAESDQHENYAYNLSMVLLNADPALLVPQESAVLASPCFLPDLRSSFSERLQMLSWDEATCWEKLEAFCEEGKDKQYANEVNLGHAERIVESLARFGLACEGKIHALLSQRIDNYQHHPMKWMEPLAVRLAGRVRMESATPLLIAKLAEDGGDLLNEDCAAALARIGSPAVVEAVAEAFPAAPRHFRIYATGPLENIRTDLAVDKCLRLLRQEKEEYIQMNLAYALLSHFAHEGIEEARRLLVGRTLDFHSKGLRQHLIETCTIMGERFPEYDQWRATEIAEKEEHWRRVNELAGDPAGLLQFAVEKLIGKKIKAPPPRPAEPSPPPAPRQRLALQLHSEKKQKVGRNEPCPCGSGKKFKQCCLRRGGE